MTSNSIFLRWEGPEKANGAIEGYRVYYKYANYTDVQSIKHHGSDSTIHYNLINLSKYKFIYNCSLFIIETIMMRLNPFN